jgi:hypothetical protein
MTPVARGNESGYLQTLSFPKTHSPLAPAAEQSRKKYRPLCGKTGSLPNNALILALPILLGLLLPALPCTLFFMLDSVLLGHRRRGWMGNGWRADRATGLR